MTIDHHHEWLGLLDEILRDPEADAPRLIAADWLEDHGQADRAEFIRSQIALAVTPGCRVEGKVVNWGTPMRACRVVFPDPHDGKGQGPHCDACRSFVRLSRREAQLFSRHGTDWLADFYGRFAGLSAKMRRGFVESVETTLALWLAHGKDVVRRHPVTSVRATCREPTRVQSDQGAVGKTRRWWPDDGTVADGPDVLPTELFRLLPAGDVRQASPLLAYHEYSDETLALSALSSAMLAWAGPLHLTAPVVKERA